VLPVILFLMAPIHAAPGGVTNAGASIARLSGSGALQSRLWALLQYRLTTIVRVEEGPSLWFDVATLVLQLAICCALAWRGRLRLVRLLWPALTIAAVLVAVTPPTMFGVGYVADRMPLFFTLVAASAIATAFRGDGFERGCVALLAMIVAVRLVAIAAGWHVYAGQYDQFRSLAARIPPGSLVAAVSVGDTRLDDSHPRCQMYGPLLISGFGQVSPLFADADKQPLRQTGRLQSAMAAWQRAIAPARHDYDWLVDTAGPAGFDYVLVCNSPGLLRPIPARYERVGRTASFVLLKTER
jgi:hypothetical protein